jgi:Holliday junction DNA helicase RuvB
MAINKTFMQTMNHNSPTTNISIDITQVEGSYVSPVKRGMDIFTGTDVIADLDEFVGQDLAKRQLKLAINSAKARSTRLGHTLLASGTPGCGKTTLAKLIAWEMGVGILECTGPISSDEALALIGHLQDGDILCIDEAHTLGKKADWLLSLMTEGTMLTSAGPEQMPNITILCATTHSSKLSDALLSRFEVKPRLEAYTDDEATHITIQLTDRLGVELDWEQCEKVALAGNNNPRAIKSLLTIVRDMQATGAEVDLALAFEYAGVTADGLDHYATDVLIALLGTTNNTASQSTIGAIVGESDNIALTEKTLLASRSGRSLTRHGVQRAKQLLG